MGKLQKQMRWIIVLGGLIFIGVLVYSSWQANRNQFEVCMAFKGASHCATAMGATSSQAIRSAQEIDCQLLSRGRDENMVCLDTQPSSVRAVR